MHLFRNIFVVTLCVLSVADPAWAQVNLDAQLDAVNRAHQSQRAVERKAEKAAVAAAAEKARIRAEKKAKLDAAQTARKEKLEDLKVEREELAVEKIRKETTRHDEFIDRDLADQDASTEIKKSTAKGIDNVSGGIFNFLSDDKNRF